MLALRAVLFIGQAVMKLIHRINFPLRQSPDGLQVYPPACCAIALQRFEL